MNFTFRFIFGCWHSLTTLSISFHVFSIVFRSITTDEEHVGSADVEEEEEEGEDAPDPAWPFTDTWLKAPFLNERKPLTNVKQLCL